MTRVRRDYTPGPTVFLLPKFFLGGAANSALWIKTLIDLIRVLIHNGTFAHDGGGLILCEDICLILCGAKGVSGGVLAYHAPAPPTPGGAFDRRSAALTARGRLPHNVHYVNTNSVCRNAKSLILLCSAQASPAESD